MQPIPSRQRGFTLIDLMVAVAIVGILGAIAVTSFRSQTLKGHRSDALTTLSSLSQSLERCYAQNYVYNTCAGVTAGPNPSLNTYYSVSATFTASTYTLTAVPSGTQTADSTCASFTLTNVTQSAKDNLGTDQTVTCWGSH